MNKLKLKKLAALGMAVVLAATSFQYTAINTKAAPVGGVDIPVEFVGDEDGGKNITTVVAENSAEITFKLGEYKPDVPPFLIKQKDGAPLTEAEAAKYITYNQDANGKYFTTSSIAASDAAPATGRSVYGISGNFQAVTAKGRVNETWPATSITGPPPSGTTVFPIDPAGGYEYQVMCTAEQTIYTDSAIKLVAAADEALNGAVTFTIDPGVTPTGIFEEHLVSGVSSITGYKQLNSKEMTINITNNNNKTLSFVLTPQQRHSDLGDDSLTWVNGKPKPTKTNDKIIKDSTFTLVFNKPTSSNLILNVVTPLYMVNDIADLVGGMTSRLNYILLTGNDTLERISKKFTLVTEKMKFGAKAKIDWVWTPDDPLYQNLLRGVADGNVTIDDAALPEDDVTGVMSYTVSYVKKDMTVVPNTPTRATAIPITIKGRGKPPYVQLTNQKIGKNSPESIIKVPPQALEDATKVELYTPNLMDVYQGDVENYKAPVAPYYFNEIIYMGEKSATADYMTITATDPEAVEIIVGSNINPYQFGEKIANDNPTGKGAVDVSVRAKTGNHNTRLTYEFYQTYNGVTELIKKIESGEITVDDTTPSDNADLKELEVKVSPKSASYPKDKDPILAYGFTPEKTSYPVEPPYKAEYVRVRPVASDELNATVVMTQIGGGVGGTDKVITEKEDIYLPEKGQKVTVKVEVTAQNPNKKKIYLLNFTRKAMDSEARLKTLEVFTEKEASAPNVLEGFEPDKFEYEMNVRFSIKRLRLTATPMSEWVQSVTFSPKPESWDRIVLFSIFQTKDAIWLNEVDSGPPGPTVIKTTVKAEAGNTRDYIIKVTQDPPSEENKLKDLAVFREDKIAAPFEDIDGKPVPFDPETPDYSLSIPYTTEKLTIQAPPLDEWAQKVTLVWPDGKTEEQTFKSTSNKVLEFKDLDISLKKYPKTVTLRVFATAESSMPLTAAQAGVTPYMLYSIEITRRDPDTDTSVASMRVTDAEDKDVENFSFNPEQQEYDVLVPYVTKSVRVYAAATSPMAKVTINDKAITEKKPYASFNLTPGKTEIVKVVIKAESGETQTYTIRIKRSLPSTEARLSKLEPGGGLKLNRIFVPKDTSYSVTIPEGTKGFTVSADTVDPFATFTIQGAKGTPNAAHTIKIVDPVTTVLIEVTAQDGKTKKTYKLKVTDENLIIKSQNADLESLLVNYGDMAPKFKPAIQTYEVYVKDDVMSVDIIPTPADANATVEVFMGSKQLGDFDGNFAAALIEDENAFKIKVTPQDKKITPKEYGVTVYRNDDDKKGNLKPITPDMIDYEGQNPIIVDISKYAIVSAEVLTKLKEYPDKTMIFQGNDYSFEVKGSDLGKLVPNTTSFDFSMSFTSPDEDAIWEVMDEYSGNSSLNPVFVYFGHHGELPAQMKFTLSLGSKYKNKKLYWNYYNAERERIDYYGYVMSNAKGAFALPINHMSTYIVTDKPIKGAENKTGQFGAGENLGLLVNQGKPNPNTAADGEGLE